MTIGNDDDFNETVLRRFSDYEERNKDWLYPLGDEEMCDYLLIIYLSISADEKEKRDIAAGLREPRKRIGITCYEGMNDPR